MDSQRDMYIKEMLQKDKIISDKANDVFNNFFNNQQNINETDEKVTKIDDYRKNRTPKRWMTAVASLVVVLLVGNTYASTQGYDNIFFAIKDWTSNIIEDVTSKEEILTDKELVISYQNIDITDKVKIQVNELEVKDNDAKLFIRVNAEAEDNLSKIPMNIVITDITSAEPKVLANYQSKVADVNTIFTEEIELKGFSDNTQRIKVELQTNNFVSLSTFEINLNEKQIDIIDGKKVTFKKISEIDLKEKLGLYIGYKNFLVDFENEIDDENIIKYQNEAKLMVAQAIAVNQYQNPTLEQVNKAFEEIYGDKVDEYVETANAIIGYNEKNHSYEYVYAGDYNPFGLCLEISDISFVNGSYTVEFAYCRPSEDDYLEGTIEELPIFTETLSFNLNENAEFTEYCIGVQ